MNWMRLTARAIRLFSAIRPGRVRPVRVTILCISKQIHSYKLAMLPKMDYPGDQSIETVISLPSKLWISTGREREREGEVGGEVGWRVMRQFHCGMPRIIFPRNSKPENWSISIQIPYVQMIIMQRWANDTSVSNIHRNVFNFQLNYDIRDLVPTSAGDCPFSQRISFDRIVNLNNFSTGSVRPSCQLLHSSR